MEANKMMKHRCRRMVPTNKWLGLVMAGSLAALIVGCASTARETRSYRSYETGKQSKAGVGAPMLIRESGTIEKKRRWVGILRSPDGWETIGTKYADDFSRKEVVYQGRSGTLIKVIYRVFHAGSAVPVHQENLTFDLSESNLIVVKDFRLKVLKTGEDSILYVVIAD